MKINIEAAAFNSIGGRKNNEDNFYLNGISLERSKMDLGGKVAAKCRDNLQIYGVFDGMGGGEYGEDCSCLAAERLKEYQEKNEHPDNSRNLKNFLTKCSKEIDERSAEHGLKSGACGTTAAMLVIGDWWYRTAHVGDSRVYLMRDGILRRVTKDQSLVQNLVDAGRITLEEAFDHPKKNVITHHLGMPLRGDELESVVGERMPLQVGDLFLICSDGVGDSLRDREIEALLDKTVSPDITAKIVVQEAKKGADRMRVQSDNITAVVVLVKEVADEKAGKKRVTKLSALQKLFGVLTGLFFAAGVATLMQVIWWFFM